MNKNFIFTVILFTLFFFFLSQTAAQGDISQQTEDSSESLVIFDMTGFPEWVKDVRRFDIITFGSFPFSMFFVSFFYDIYRWNNANGMDFSVEGRIYAPWPLRSAGGIEKTNIELRNTILISAGLSVIIAIVDLIIFKTRQKKELNRIQSISPSSSVTIIRNHDENTDELDGLSMPED
jgi:hypothetical protein